MSNQKGVIHLLLPLLLLLAAALFALFYFGIIKLPFSLPTFQKQLTKVELKTEYKNPFDKKTQFVNPFDKYKNPFVVNR